MLDDNEPDATSDDDDDDGNQTLKSTPPPSVNNHHTSVPAVPTLPNPPNASSRKRSSPPIGSQAPSTKRTRGSPRVAARKAREAEGVPMHSDCHKEGEETLHHVFPRHCWDKEWEVVDIGGVCMEEDGSLNCKLLWAPTTALVSSLKGVLLGRAEELVKRDLGVDAWNKWLEMQGKTGPRCRSKGANSQGGK